MNYKNIIISVVVALVVVVGLAFLGVFDGRDGQDGRNGTNGIGSPAFNYTNNGGVLVYYRNAAIKNATSTLCAFRSPAATSTLTHASFTINTATATAQTIYIGRGANTQATTTALMTIGMAANSKQEGLYASSTQFRPNQYVTFDFNGQACATVGACGIYRAADNAVGSCSAIFTVN